MGISGNISGIYKITSPTGRIYIGQSKCIRKRVNTYRAGFCKNQIALYASFQKHGFSSHVIEVIHQLPPDVDLNVKNEYELLYYNFYVQAGFSMLNSKTPGSVGELTEEARMKISKYWKGRKRSNQQIEKHREFMKGTSFRKGKKATKECKARMSIIRKGINTNTREHMERINKMRKGKPMPREAIERMMKTRLERGSYKKINQCLQS